MTTIEPVRIDCSEVVEGDLVVFLGKVHRITSIEPYRHPDGQEGRIAADGTDWQITLFPGTGIEVIR